MRKEFILAVLLVLATNFIVSLYWSADVLWSLVVFGPLIVMGFADMLQHKQAIRSNFPVAGRLRYIFEQIRPEINQYFVESNTDGRPFNREDRSVVYQRAKGVNDTIPFGTQKDVYEVGYEWLDHSIAPQHPHPDQMRVMIGQRNCSQPYDASILNISAMSYGALSKNAIEALNGGASDGGFAHNTGEGGISPYHKAPGGDLIWQIGTGYFGCRSNSGGFDPEKFKKESASPQVKMIEIKLSQGAKPGHGGILPANKVTKEISEIRGVPIGKDVNSPPAHTAFSTPIEFLEFIKSLRELSGGKPVGFKICIGRNQEFVAMCKAMVKTGITPDFICVDGGEGGTGAAPIEYSNHIGTPGIEALILVNNLLTGFSLRDKIKLISTGKVSSGFGMIQRMILGADVMYSARAMMMSLGCIQALKCNQNHCPTGVATQQEKFYRGLHIPSKRIRVARFHHETVSSVAQIIGAMGLNDTSDLRPEHLNRRISAHQVKRYDQLYDFLKPGVLLDPSNIPSDYQWMCETASADAFKVVDNKS